MIKKSLDRSLIALTPLRLHPRLRLIWSRLLSETLSAFLGTISQNSDIRTVNASFSDKTSDTLQTKAES